MAPVNIKYIVSFSSQDQNHKASNIVSGDGTKKWLSDCSDRSGKIEAILQLEESCQLAYIDIGTIWCASLEIRVGRSDWPQSTEFQSLISTVSLMTPVDCRLSRGSCVTKMFSKVDFSSEVAAKKWDRLQIICRQPFRKDVQLGMSFIRLKSANPAPQAEPRVETATKLVCGENRTCPDVSSIQQHFFRKILSKTPDRASPAAQLKQRLLKISGSSEFGSEHEQSLSRTAKLVLKASENSDTQKHGSPATSTPKQGLFSDHLARQKAIPLEAEIKTFFPTLKINLSDIEKLTVADLRHKFERKKRRKLTVEEKRTFSRLCEQFICTLLDEEDETDASFASAKSHQSTPGLTHGNNRVAKKTNNSYENENATPSISLQTKHSNHHTLSGKSNTVENSPLPSPIARTETRPEFALKAQDEFIHYNEIPLNQKGGSVGAAHSSPSVKDHRFTSVASNPTSDNANFTRESHSFKDNSLSKFNLKNRIPVNSSDVSSVSDLSENDECLSSVTYDEDEEEKELSDNSDLCSPDSSPNLLNTKQKSNLENVRKSYETFYSLNTPQKKPEDNLQNSSSVKKRKLQHENFHRLQGLSTETLDIDNEQNKKGCSEYTSDSVSFTAACLSSTNPNSATATILAVDSLPPSELGPKNVSPRTPRGKVYRMLTSANAQSSKTHSQRINTGQFFVSKDFQATAGKETENVKRINGSVRVNGSSEGLSNQSAISAAVTSELAKVESTVPPPLSNLKFPPIGSSGGRGRGKEKVPGQSKISNRGRGRGKRGRQNSGAGSGSASGQNSSNTPALAHGELVFCEKCYGEFPPDVYADHHSHCVRPAIFMEEENNNSVGGPEQHEALIDETVDYSECPICLERFPQDVLPVHASECGL